MKVRGSISFKLALALSVLLVPLVVVCYLLAAEMLGAVRFAQRELNGIDYLVSLQQLHGAVVEAQAGSVAKMEAAPGWGQALGTLEDLIDSEQALAPDSAAALLQSLGTLPSAVSAESLAAAEMSLRQWVTHVGDTSNLILDPDLDTYYVMDITLLRTFDAATRIRDLQLWLGGLGAKGELSAVVNALPYQQLAEVIQAMRVGAKTASGNTADDAVLQPLADKIQLLEQAFRSLDSAADVATALENIKSTSTALDGVFAEASDVLTQLLETRVSQQHRRLGLLLGGVASCTLVACLLAGWMLRRIMRRLNEAMRLARQVASGDLAVSSTNIGGVRGDETSELMGALLSMVEMLHTTILQARVTAEDLSEASEQLSAVSVQAAGTSHTISRSAGEMTGAVEQLAKRIEAIVFHVKEAQVMSKKSMILCSSGSDVIKSIGTEMREVAGAVDNASNAIRELEQQSNKISSIVSVIKDIADQTNLLALNAAIEAARAGEQGRGFSVVADEVRQLAARTSQSTQEITQMIGKIQEGTRSAVGTMEAVVNRVDQGSGYAIRADEAISEIRSVVSHVTGVVSDITNDVDEQSAASASIQLEIDRIARQSRDNAVAVEQTASTAQRLSEHAVDLKEWVQLFKVHASTPR